MVIGVNALYLKPGEVGGSETYLRELVPRLAALAPSEPHLLFLGREAAQTFAGLPPNVRVVGCPISTRSRATRILYEQLRLPRLAERLGAEVLFSPGITAPAWGRLARVTTVYDLQHVRHPEHFFPSHALAWRALVWLSVRRSGAIVTLSESSRRDIAAHYRLDARAIRVIPLAPPEDVLAEVDEARVEAVLRTYGIERPFLLGVSTTHPHKGIDVLLRAFAELSREPAFRHRLVLVGPRGFAHDRLLSLTRELDLAGRISFLGWIPRADLVALYRSATLLACPSIFEGFGLPVVEAMAAGLPIVASRIPPLVEIAGDACEWVEPGNAPALGAALHRALDDPEVRSRLIASGRERARAFSWDRTARETMAALEEAVRSHGEARRRAGEGRAASERG